MRFDTAEFAVFFATVWLLARAGGGRWLLLLASYLFYARWHPLFLALLAASTVLDFSVARALDRTSRTAHRRLLLGLSITGNLGLLFYFKYAGFLVDTLASSGLLAEHLRFAAPVVLPPGLSFYTFQTLGYTIDVYRRQVASCRSLPDFALFVAFFPQLLAGPIVRADELLPQIEKPQRPSRADTLSGLELCLVGLFKKMVVADNLAVLVNTCFADTERLSGVSLTVGAVAFSGQIYADFSGYSTLARGLALLLGFRLPENFGFPLLSGSPIEYRRQWHITLARWFRDHVYRPLGGDRSGTATTVRNTLITWTLFGLWHGPRWNYVLWGLGNGILLALHRVLRGRLSSQRSSPWSARLGVLSFPLFLIIANVIFRASDLEHAGLYYTRMFGLAPGESVSALWPVALATLLALHAVSRRLYREDVLVSASSPARGLWIAGMLALIYGLAGPPNTFYYFAF